MTAALAWGREAGDNAATQEEVEEEAQGAEQPEIELVSAPAPKKKKKSGMMRGFFDKPKKKSAKSVAPPNSSLISSIYAAGW